MNDTKTKPHLRVIEEDCPFCSGLGCNLCYFGKLRTVINEDGIPVPL